MSSSSLFPTINIHYELNRTEPTTQAVIDNRVTTLDIWTEVQTSLEQLEGRVKRGKAEHDDTAEALGRLKSTMADVVGNSGGWVDSQHLETVLSSLRRDVKDMQDR